MVATTEPESGHEDVQRFAAAMSTRVPQWHPSRDAVGMLLQQLCGLLAAPVAPPQQARGGSATSHAAAAAGTVSTAEEREASEVRNGRKRRALAAARRADEHMFDEGSEQAAQVGRAPATPHFSGGRVDSDEDPDLQSPWSGYVTPAAAPASLQDEAGEVRQQRVEAAMSAFAGGSQESSGNPATAAPGASPGG